MRRLLCTGLLLSMVALSACGGGSDPAPPKPKASASASPTASASTEPTPTASPAPSPVPRPSTTAEAAKMAVVVLGENPAEGPEEEAVVAAWLAYWDAVSLSYAQATVAPELDSVASGQARQNVLTYVSELRSRGHRSVGWARDNVLAIDVTGDAASLRVCSENFSFEVDAQDRPKEKVTPFYLEAAKLRKDGDRWIVDRVDFTYLDRDCRT
jgi:hypothetical protein